MKSILLLTAAVCVAATPALGAGKVCADCVVSNMERLTAPDLRGRACGTVDEQAAARFIAARLKAYKVPAGGPDGAYLQRVDFQTPTFAAPPSVSVGTLRFVHGQDVLVLNSQPALAAPLTPVSATDDPAQAAGKAVILDAYEPARLAALFRAGAIAAVVPANDRLSEAWDQLAARPPGATSITGVEAAAAAPSRTTVVARPEAYAALRAQAGATLSVAAPVGPPTAGTTYNVLGTIRGTAPDADAYAILLSAHYDHLGVVNGVLYPGANDDASGTAAVLEFARQIRRGKPPKRTVHFALYGCEESGGFGSRYYQAHPPAPLSALAANLQFEMIGASDPERPDTLMLTGWERSNLGPALKANGADIAADRYPQENFFQRSDNYALARRGVVAQTVSAWPVTPTYHQPTDTLASIDMPFMLRAIQSLVKPIAWLLNSDFRPQWNEGMKP